MRAKIIAAGLCLLAGSISARPVSAEPPPAADPVADKERSALALRYLELTQPDWLNGAFEVDHTLDYFAMPRAMEEINLRIKGVRSSRSPITRIVYGQLKASFESGAKKLTPQLTDAMVAVYAKRLTTEELRTLVAFEEQPSQRAFEARAAHAFARMQARVDAEGAGWDAELKTGVIQPPSLPSPDDLEPLTPVESQTTPTESQTWAAIAGKEKAIYLDTYAELNRLWPQVAEIAQADYCAHIHCGAGEREILTGLGQVFADPNNRV